MDAAVSLHVHGALPLPASSHHRTLHHLKATSFSSSAAAAAAAAASAKNQQQPRARLAVTAARPSTRSSSTLARTAAAPRVVQQQKHRLVSSSRAATGYAAALADASLRAGTLHRAARHARALLISGADDGVGVADEDIRVVALVRMLVGKGNAAMVADVMAEFAAICDRLLLPARAHAATSY